VSREPVRVVFDTSVLVAAARSRSGASFALVSGGCNSRVVFEIHRRAVHAMSEVTIKISEALRKTIEKVAAQEGYSLEQFVASAAGEKMAALRTVEYLRQEAAAGSRADFERFLATVPARPVPDTDVVD
jgi:uncharacterized protein (DUF1778 family)